MDKEIYITRTFRKREKTDVLFAYMAICKDIIRILKLKDCGYHSKSADHFHNFFKETASGESGIHLCISNRMQTSEFKFGYIQISIRHNENTIDTEAAKEIEDFCVNELITRRSMEEIEL